MSQTGIRSGGVAIPAVAAALRYATPISADEKQRRNFIDRLRRQDAEEAAKNSAMEKTEYARVAKAT